MTDEQNKQKTEEKSESGMPGGGAGRVDEVGESGVYPVSAMEGAESDAIVHGEASFGQGERGAAGYEDSGGSELFYLDAELGKSAESQNTETGEKSKEAQGGKND